MLFFTADDLILFWKLACEEVRYRYPNLNVKAVVSDESVAKTAFMRLLEEAGNGNLPEAPANRNPPAPKSSIMNVHEAAAYLRISQSTLYKWTSQHKIPYRKVGSKKLSFMKEELDQFLRNRRIADPLEIDERASRIATSLRVEKKKW